MNVILVINDNSPEAKRAAEYALLMTQKVQAKILLANTFNVNNRVVEKAPVEDIAENGMEEQSSTSVLQYLSFLNNRQTGFKPEIEEFDISHMDESELSEVVNKNHIWMIVKGMSDLPLTVSQKKKLNFNTILKKVQCPLLLIPASWQLKPIERLVYVADLRYCCIQVVRYLATLAKPLHADLSIAHLSAKGLPDMDDSHANCVFKAVSHNVGYDHLNFNIIKEKNVKTTVDVLINAMQNDLLALVYHNFHFEEIMGQHIKDSLPSHITIPLLIFPF